MFTTTTQLDETCHSQARPTALLSVGKNIMPLSWHMPVSKSPFRYAICVRDENTSHQLLYKHKEFALNFLDFSYIESYEKTGNTHGGDKFSLAKLEEKKAKEINTTLIEESYMIYECKIIDRLNYGDHDVFIADVVCIHNLKSDNVKPTLFMGKGYYETTSQSPLRLTRH